MEQQLLANCHRLLSPEIITSTTATFSLLPFSLARTLITNPSTSDETLSSLVETLTPSPHNHSHHTLSLLSDLVSLQPNLSHLIATKLHSFCLLPDAPPRNLALALSISELDHTLNETLFVSLSFRPSISVRQSLLRNAQWLHIRPSLLLTVFLGFTKDPYPFIRSVALDGLVNLCKCIAVQDRGMIEGCYCRAVELLFDSEDCVRCSAVHAVSEWGQILVAANEDGNKGHWSDAIFLMLCSMVRDMNVKVRVAAFDNLAKIVMVSEDILKQTLSKKVLPITKEKKYHGQFSSKEFEIPGSSAAGAFIHGLEDEFHEVRRSACNSLRTLVILSADFAAGALNLLMDVLSDDLLSVRLQALETMHHMVVVGHLKLQEVHMHMFLGTLVDTSTLVRFAARKVLRITKLHNLAMFKLSVDSLIQNLEMYPQDEADVFSVLFNMGRCHGKYAVSIIKEVSSEIEPSSGGLDSAKTAAWLVLAISATLSHLKTRQLQSIPPVLFSYAVTMLGRISRGLTDVVDQNALLAYLSHCSESTELTKGEDTVLSVAEDDLPNVIHSHIPSPVGLDLDSHGASEKLLQGLLEPSKVAASLLDIQLVQDEANNYVKLIFTKIEEILPLVKVGCINEVFGALRSWKEELGNFITDSLQSVVDIVFSLQYLRVMKMLVKVWLHFMTPRTSYSNKMAELGVNIGKLGRRLKEVRYRFVGLTKKEEMHILELILVTCTLRLSSVDACGHESALRKLYSTMSRVDFLHKDESIELSTFVTELKKLLGGADVSIDRDAHNPFMFSRLLEFFTLKQFPFCGKLKYVKAELQVKDNGNSLPFVPGLPVGIPLQITLCNTSNESRLWVKIASAQEFADFVFLDLNELRGSDETREFPFTAPFYRTPKAKSLTLRICIVMECLSEDVHLLKACTGAKRDLVYLCKEQEVCLSMVQ